MTKKERLQKRRQRIVFGVCCLILLVIAGMAIKEIGQSRQAQKEKKEAEGETISRPDLDVELLTPNEYSRPEIPLAEVRGVVIHYTANPGTSAIANRNYFEGLKDSHITKASSHFIVGLEGEIVQCIPCQEIAYASNQRNVDTISIECCIGDESGRFNTATYRSVTYLTAWLLQRYGLSPSAVIRHYDVTGKMCPKYYVEHPEAWTQFLEDVGSLL